MSKVLNEGVIGLAETALQYLIWEYNVCLEEESKRTSIEKAEAICIVRVFVGEYKELVNGFKVELHERVEKFVEARMKKLLEKGGE